MATYEDTRYDFDASNLTGITLVETGTIIPWPTSSVPTGYLDCDGAAVSRTTYADLFAVVGTTYGTGDGSTTFNVPDIKDRICKRTTSVGTTGGANNATCSLTVANTTLSLSQLPSHNHSGSPTKGSDGIGFGNSTNSMRYQGNYNWSNTGGSGSHGHSPTGGTIDTKAPFVATFFIIKT